MCDVTYLFPCCSVFILSTKDILPPSGGRFFVLLVEVEPALFVYVIMLVNHVTDSFLSDSYLSQALEFLALTI